MTEGNSGYASTAELALYGGDFNLEDHIPFWFARTQMVVHRGAETDGHPALLAIADLTQRDIRVVSLIGMKGTVSPSAIAEASSIDRATVARALAVLVKKRLIVLLQNAQDGRGKFAGLTALGAQYCDVLYQLMDSYGNFLEEKLEPDEKKQLFSLLKKLRDRSKESRNSIKVK
ncbi:MAG: MarR family transcriptional regulator [Kordiimonadaceae bacterium]|nr:MarR family transcriptional regulator [Porticoccaceae bacterium]MBL4838660.1 MarR family transcriptional regulator [Kordiimonadaceae bacterium]